MLDANWQALGTLIGVLGFAFTAFRYIAGIREALSAKMLADKDGLITRITTAEEKFLAKLVGIAEQTRLMIDAAQERESKQRSDLANTLMAAIADMRRESKALDEKFTSMRIEMIRRADLNEAVNSVMSALDRQEKRFEILVTKAGAH